VVKKKRRQKESVLGEINEFIWEEVNLLVKESRKREIKRQLKINIFLQKFLLKR